MEIEVKREQFLEADTLGHLSINGVAECVTLEPKYRGLISGQPLETIKAAKVPGKTAIPTGRYQILSQYWGAPHNRNVPTLQNVPGFSGVGIHSGATDKDTLGCILVGQSYGGPDLILNGWPARDALYPKIFTAIEAGEAVWITIQ